MKTLLIVDVQNDFLPGGALPVSDGDKIIPVINALQKKFSHIIATRDWHPANHVSFASNHESAQVGKSILIKGLPQTLWPDHCVQGSPGAELSPLLDQKLIDRTFFKGDDPEIDSYSAFFDNGRLKQTGLHQYLKNKGVTDLYVTGLAADICVYYTVKDALSLGYKTWLVTDATLGVNLKATDTEVALQDMTNSGAQLISSEKL
jgi:nicotinamidase/pyrazinamidase